MNNIVKRIISSFVILPIIVYSLLEQRLIFEIIIIISGILMLIEWYKMTKNSYSHTFYGIFLIMLTIISLLKLSHIDPNGMTLLLYICFISSVDIGAMVGGKIIGGKKLASKISPNKTYSGLISGVALSQIILYLFYYYAYNLLIIPHNSVILLHIMAIFFAILAQISDLLVSIFKRKHNVKDTGNIIPGHGGVLDRLDSYILTAPILAFFLI